MNSDKALFDAAYRAARIRRNQRRKGETEAPMVWWEGKALLCLDAGRAYRTRQGFLREANYGDYGPTAQARVMGLDPVKHAEMSGRWYPSVVNEVPHTNPPRGWNRARKIAFVVRERALTGE